MLIETRQQLSKVRTESLMVGEGRNLAVWFDFHFQFFSHINKTCQLAFFSLYNIRRVSLEAVKS